MKTVLIVNIVGLSLLLVLITAVFIWLIVSDYKRVKNGEKGLFWKVESRERITPAKAKTQKRK